MSNVLDSTEHGVKRCETDLTPAERGDGRNQVHQPTRLHMLARLLWLCFYSVAMVAGGNAMLVLPQIREGLWTFDDGEGHTLRRQAIFVLAYLYWAVTTWYVARLTLGRQFPHDSVGSMSAFVHGVAKWLPRLLSLAACVPLALFLLGTGKHPALALVLLLVSLLFIAFTWVRRRLTRMKGNPSYYRFYDQLQASSWLTLMIGFAAPHLMLLAILAAPIASARLIGAPALILMAMGAWSLVGGMLLSYWPRTRGWVTLSWLPVLLLVLFDGDNHPIDWHAGKLKAAKVAAASASSIVAEGRPSLQEHYERWIKQHPDGEPVYFVASAGGASRASYWAGVLLGRLEDEARAEKRRFGSNIFMMSGVSGGSVGIAAYAAALRTWPASAPDSGPAPAACIRLAMDKMLGADVLSPIGALLLYPDLMQRFLPVSPAAQRYDRSRGLEETWVHDWQALLAQAPAGCALPVNEMGNLWTQPLKEALVASAGTPALVLNTARLEDGRRILQSNVAFDLRDADDLLGFGFEARARSISLAGAAHNSARFPLVSPPGSVRTVNGKLWGHLGDGGYHEVTGTATLADVVEELIDLGCLRRDPPRAGELQPTRLLARPQCGRGVAVESGAPATAAAPEARVVIVVIDNTPTGYPAGWQRDLEGKPRVWPRKDREEILRNQPLLPLVELTGPIFGLLTHNSQEGRSSEHRLAALAGTDPFSMIELRMPRYRGLREPSMNWQLDRESRGAMMCAADRADRAARPVLSAGPDDTPCSGDGVRYLPRADDRPANLADAALQCNLERLRAWIGQHDGKPTLPAPAAASASAPERASR